MPPAKASDRSNGIRAAPRSWPDCPHGASREASHGTQKASRGDQKASREAAKASRGEDEASRAKQQASRGRERASRETLGGQSQWRGVFDAVRGHLVQTSRRAALPHQPPVLKAPDLVAADHAALNAGDFEDAGD